jgi:carbon-monoxide dehydrogenase medium subunit
MPTPAGGGAYLKFERRAGDFAVASVGVQLALNGQRCRSAAISLGAVGATPIRARAAESLLQDQAISAELLEKAEHLVREAAQPFADTRGSVAFKRHLAGVLFRRAFAKAAERCT